MTMQMSPILGLSLAGILLLLSVPALDGLDAACPASNPECRREPTLSIIFITKRPGGYDVLLESLSRQTSRDYELICIDDLGAGQRHSDAAEYALRKGVPLAAMLQSKPKVRGHRFGQCNAINSGLAVSRGSFITVVQDNVWLPSTFVERTVGFFSEHERDVLLSYPERRIAAPAGRLSKELMASHTAMSVFDPPVERSPEESGWEIIDFNNTMTPDIYEHVGEDRAMRTAWFECAACTASFELYAALNGLDEALDVGDDAQEANVKDRCEREGGAIRGRGGDKRGMGEAWVDLGTAVELIDHHSFESDDDDTWSRFERDTNVHRWRATLDLVELGEYPAPEAPNAFDLKAVRGDGGRGGAWKEAVQAGKRQRGVLVDVDWDKLPSNDVGEDVMRMVDTVMGPRFGFKPDILVLHSMSSECFEGWQDGLKRALRLIRRHFHITFMYVGYLRAEEQPTIDFEKLKNTFHMMLGLGSFFGPVDYFMRQYSDQVVPKLVAEGKQKVAMAMLVISGIRIPDGDAVDVYDLVIYPTDVELQRAISAHPRLNARVAIGVSSAIADQPCQEEEASAEAGVVTVGDLSPHSRMEFLVGGGEEVLVVGKECDAHMRDVSKDIREELQGGGVTVQDWVGEGGRRQAYCRARQVYFPMSEDGGGWLEVLEAISVGADVRVEKDNEILGHLVDSSTREKIPDETGYAASLVSAMWSVLIHGAAH